MSKGTQIAKLTLVNFVGPLFTELGLVLLRVVEVFHSVVSLWTVVTQWAGICLGILAQLRGVGAKGSSPVFFMEVDALFLIVPPMDGAWLCLEKPQI